MFAENESLPSFISAFVHSISFSEKEKVVCFCSFIWDISWRVWEYFLINSVSFFFYFSSLFVMALRQLGRFDTTRKTCSVSHCSWFRMQPWVYFILTLFSTLNDNFFTLIKDASFQDFVNSPSMSEIKERSCFIHVDVPGHADNSGPLADKWVALIFEKKRQISSNFATSLFIWPLILIRWFPFNWPLLFN